MVKGFKDEDGKFHPTEKKQGISSDFIVGLFDEPSRVKVDPTGAVELKKQKGRIKEIRVFKFDELEPDVQEKVIEKERQNKVQFLDPIFFAEDEGILTQVDTKPQFFGNEVFKNVIPKFYDVASNRGTDFIQFELEFKEPELGKSEKKLTDFLGISEKLRRKIDIGFENTSTRFGGDNNTIIVFDDFESGGKIDLEEDPADFPQFTEEEFEVLRDANEKWDSLMSNALQNLTNNFEDQFTDETIKEDITANELEFEEDGTIA